MNKLRLKQDISALVNARGISLHKLALDAGVDTASLWRFMNRENSNLNTDSLFKLWPHIYGEQTPVPLAVGMPEAPATPDADKTQETEA